MLALLLDAVIQLQRRGTTSATAAASWVRGDDGMHDAPVSFANVCATLDIDVEHLRRGLLRGIDERHVMARTPRRRRSRAALPPRRARRQSASPLMLVWMLVLHAITHSPLWVRLIAIAIVPLVIGGVTALVLPDLP